MRTLIMLGIGFMLLAAIFFYSKLFSEYYPSTPYLALSTFLATWLIASGFNLWVGINKAGYDFGAEFPIMLLIFVVPAAAAFFIKWKMY